MLHTSYQNPILPGFHPDPSICRVGEDYYLVNSTFSYFPGVPIFHSKDLIHWTQIGNVLDRLEQLDLTDAEHSGGIFAPTIRYYAGTFYMITTNIGHGGNFIVTASNPAGPWSKPYFLEDADGIDPSLFFDEDGRCYYCGTKDKREGGAFWGDNEIYIQELDLESMRLIGPNYAAWHGALKNCEWQEGPHIYKKDGFYYLMIAEGGTGLNHAVTIARSKSLFTPFEGCIRNPILTHRHLGKQYPIINTGHADLVDTPDGNWFMVLLASRPCDGYCNLGRETFLVPVTWEDGWPVINYGIGLVEEISTMRSLHESLIQYNNYNCLTDHNRKNEITAIAAPSHSLLEQFESDHLPPYFMYLRNPIKENYRFDKNHSHLRLYSSHNKMVDKKSPTAVFIRQTDFSYVLETKLTPFFNQISTEAGIVLLQSNLYHYRFFITKDKFMSNLYTLKIVQCIQGEESTLLDKEGISLLCTQGDEEHPSHLFLKVMQKRQHLSFAYSLDGLNYHTLIQEVDASILSTEKASGFVGTCLGIYIQDSLNNCIDYKEAVTKDYADFDWLSYQNFNE